MVVDRTTAALPLTEHVLTTRAIPTPAIHARVLKHLAVARVQHTPVDVLLIQTRAVHIPAAVVKQDLPVLAAHAPEMHTPAEDLHNHNSLCLPDPSNNQVAQAVLIEAVAAMAVEDLPNHAPHVATAVVVAVNG